MGPEEAGKLAANIFAQNLYERGFNIHSITIEYGTRKVKTPHNFNEKLKLNKSDIESLTGLKLAEPKIKQLLEKARYRVTNLTVFIPNYRRDALHAFDIIEDIAIVYGFNKIESAAISSYTVGASTEMNQFVDLLREVVLGLGFQEILSPILSNTTILEHKMEAQNTGIIEIQNVMSDTYSAVRSWITPIMLEVLSKNKHHDYPQKIFEQGIVSLRKGGKVQDKEMIALAISHSKTDFTEIKQSVDAIMKSIGLKYSIEPSQQKTFIVGRGGKIIAKGSDVGLIGEISPSVLVKWQLEMPVAVLELDLSELKRLTSSS